MSPRFLKLAAVFYGLLVVAAAAWNALRGREMLWIGDDPALSLLAGTLTAAGTVALGLLLYRAVPLLRRLADELAPQIVDRASPLGLVLVSVYSGVGEEAFFRGAVQPEFGLVVAAVAFGLVHIGPDRRYLIWTAWALAAGFLFGFLYEWTGGLLAPMLAHTLHNAATLLLWKRRRSRK
ncbi:CPBP family intramembrane metalloprotease [Rubrobacter taiwanensis]|jgi:membrane protease YdiL (CAAX protease family)|uniref:CPBP family intramembrane metalloprotease n=1 Tax=Rubrobacter taiwanensis TaxID=185139 RepID=A0A4R1BJA0_9ACTN|nr:CPBP family intramembrane glutamic endopeptidase [Rubrobacter taiwanensis]TCJ17364.1 CPBP family intramembrane metalloprotease [Rubrobacter taiwanensis]